MDLRLQLLMGIFRDARYSRYDGRIYFKIIYRAGEWVGPLHSSSDTRTLDVWGFVALFSVFFAHTSVIKIKKKKKEEASRKRGCESRKET